VDALGEVNNDPIGDIKVNSWTMLDLDWEHYDAIGSAA
jgi:hypothetical protein